MKQNPDFTLMEDGATSHSAHLTCREREKQGIPKFECVCYTSRINTHEGTGEATAEGLLRSLPHNGTQLYGITIEYVVSCTCYHPVHKCDA